MKSIFIFLFLTIITSPVCNFDEYKNLVWIEVASGEQQCIPPTYVSLDDAIELLTSNNIEVFDQKEVNFIVCRACSCPTGIVYQAQITESDFEKAENIGWAEANNYEE